MKKIGILTFHNVPNYGASLQAYALKEYIRKITNGDVAILDFRCRGNSEEYTPKNYVKKICSSNNVVKSIVKRVLFSIYSEKYYEGKHRKFEEFRNTYLDVIKYENAYEEFGFIFCGSDQIWNYGITDGFKPPYFGADKPDFSETKVISYAASCGDIAEFSIDKKQELFALVKELDKIGVREDGLNKELAENGIDSLKTVDPTFLLSAQEYKTRFNIEESKSKKKYLLEYALLPSRELDELSNEIASKKGLEIVKLCGYYRNGNEAGIFDAGPVDFIELVANADYIATNSFHGTTFSLIFRKDFNVVLPSSRKSRIYDLLKGINLQNRICSDYKNADASAIDYKQIEPTLDSEIEASKKFINEVF